MPFFDTFFETPPTAFGNWLQTKKANKVWERLQLHHPRIVRMLEIGPGLGEIAKIGMAAQIDYHAIEMNFTRASALRKSGVSIAISYVPPIPAKDEKFDAVVVHNVIEHMPDFSAAIRFLGEIVRVTRGNGLVFINSPDYLAATRHFWDADYTHNFPVTMRRLNQMFRDQGLEIVNKGYFSGPISGGSATLASWSARCFPVEGISFLLGSTSFTNRIHRAQMTFLRNVFMIGRKHN